MTLPRFLQEPDPDYRPYREWCRDAYAQRGEPDRPLKLNTFYGETVLDLDTALLWAERLAAEALK
jgi:hypothetical protein